MYSTLRHIILLMSAGLLLSACESDGPAGGDAVQDSEMRFAVSDISRAAITTDLNTVGSRFAVYGDMKLKVGETYNPPTTIFNNTEIVYDGNTWNYDKTQYWFPKHEHSFVAIHSYDAPGLSDKEYSGSRLSFRYTLPENYTSARDILGATHRRMYNDDTSSPTTPATLRFWHIMSRINFQLKNDGAADLVRVTKIVLEGINRTGSFAVTPAAISSGSDQTDDYNFSWTDISNNGTLEANIRVEIPETEEHPLFPDNNALLMIPQPDNKGIIMHITYTRIDAGDDDEQISLTAEAPIGGWEAGKVYTYSMTVSEITKEIYLTVSVKPWQTPPASGITVPES